MSKKTFPASVIAMALILLLMAAASEMPASPQKVDDFYKGNTINLVATDAAGLTIDLQARVFGRFLGQYTGSGVLVHNMGAASGMQGINHVWRAKPDGLTIGISTFGPFCTFELMDDPGALHSIDKFEYLGCLGRETSVFWTKADGPVKSLADLKTMKGIKFVAPAPNHEISISLMLVAHALDLNAKLATGATIAEGQLAVLQGTSAGFMSSPGSYLRNIAKGWKGLCTFDTSRNPVLPDLPALTEGQDITKERLELIQLKSSLHAGRVLFLPPGIPAEKLEYLQRAFNHIVQQGDFRSEMEKLFGYKNVPFPDAKETMNTVKTQKAKEKFLQEQYHFLIRKYAS